MGNPIAGVPVALQGEEILFRVLRSKDHGTDKMLAFLLRDNERGSGLSVSYNCTSAEAESHFDSYGVFSLIANHVAGLGLPVIADEPTHANITNVPHKDDQPVEALRIAEALSAISAVIIIRDKRQKRTAQ